MTDELSEPLNQLLTQALQESGIGLVLLDHKQHILQINDVACRYFCLQQAAYALQHSFDEHWLTEHHTKLIDIHQQPFRLAALIESESNWLGIAVNGSTRWVKWHSQPCHWQGQQASAVVLTDVTELMTQKLALDREVASTSSRDSMTGLMNRRHALTQLHVWNKHAKRYGQGFSLALIDVDFFKRLNDTFGHRFGDEVIVQVSQSLNSAVRETDMLARYGGEEFLLLMPGTALDDAMLTLDRLRQKISELKWLGVARPITVSIGVCDWQPYRSVEQLLFQTDQRLRTAKSAGRNQVCGNL